jgi:hypothetical protein
MPRKTASEKTAPTEKVLQSIRHLLARQNHPQANENEAAVSAAKVQEVLLNHRLGMTDMESLSKWR